MAELKQLPSDENTSVPNGIFHSWNTLGIQGLYHMLNAKNLSHY